MSKDTYNDWVPEDDRLEFFRIEQSLGTLEEQSMYQIAASTLFWQLYYLNDKPIAVAVLDRLNAIIDKLEKQRLSSSVNCTPKDLLNMAFVQLHLVTALLVANDDINWISSEVIEDLDDIGNKAINYIIDSDQHPYMGYFVTAGELIKLILDGENVDTTEEAIEILSVGRDDPTYIVGPSVEDLRRESCSAIMALFLSEHYKICRHQGFNQRALKSFSRAVALWDYSESGISGVLDM